MRDAITIVSGLPRSGTSMMMSMLRAGGVPLLVDGQRTADADNPKGYFEFERVKKLPHDTAWLAEARGKAVKVIAALLEHLPADHRYRVIFMRRRIEEVLDSQQVMLERRGEEAPEASAAEARSLLLRHLDEVTDWLDRQPHFEVAYVNYNRLLADPYPAARRVDALLGGGLDVEAMAAVVDPALYRQRRGP